MPRTMSKTHKSLILDYIGEHGSITHGEAYEELGVGRLSARIEELRQCGYPIETVMVKGRNRYNNPVQYAKYVMKKFN